MHRIAMQAQSLTTGINAQHKLDVWVSDASDLTSELKISEQLSNGFIEGFHVINSRIVCVVACKSAILQTRVIVDNRFGIFMADYARKLWEASQAFTDFSNFMNTYGNI